MFNINDIERTIKESNLSKGSGTDYFDGKILNNAKLKFEFIKFDQKALNKNQLSDNLKSTKLILIYINGPEEGFLVNTKLIMILRHIMKILEKIIKNKLDQNLSNLHHTGEY